MASLAKPFVALAAVIAVTACTSTPSPSPVAVTAGSSGTVKAPVESPFAAAEPSAVASAGAFECDDFTTGCAGNLTAGAHTSSNFMIPLQITVPDGWVNVRDITRTYEVEPARSSGVAGHAYIEVLTMNAIADPASCSPVPLAGAGSTVGDFIDHVVGHPGLDVKPPAPATIDGYQGQSVDFGVRSDWTAMCPDLDPYNPVVLMLTSTDTDPARRQLAYRQNVRVRWVVLDVAGETVIVEVVAPAGAYDAAMAEEPPIVDSLDFTPGG